MHQGIPSIAYPEDEKDEITSPTAKAPVGNAPKNNDGRLTCFWCGGKTKHVEGCATNWYDVCTLCGR